MKDFLHFNKKTVRGGCDSCDDDCRSRTFSVWTRSVYKHEPATGKEFTIEVVAG